MNKKERLQKQIESNREQPEIKDLYVSNTSIIKDESIQAIEETKEVIKPISGSQITNNSKIETKVVTFRIPTILNDNIDKYAYVQRMKKQDVIFNIIETFFNSGEAKEIIKEYDNIKGVQ